MMKPSIGRIVHYMLSEQDAAQINRRRTDGPSIAERIKAGAWPLGAQAHIGNHVSAGDVFPMLIIRVWGESESSCVNGQVILDGCDAFWAMSRNQVETEADDAAKVGHWFAPPRA
jgi:hypothetical protein